MIYRLSIIAFLILLIISIITCDNSKSPVIPEGTVYFSGYVLAHNLFDSGDTLTSQYYTVQTKHRALVTLRDTADIEYTALTNNHSGFSINVKPGVYELKTETDHGFPVITGLVDITGDTSMNIETTYDFTVIDTILVVFIYGFNQYPVPVMSEASERYYLDRLNRMTGNLLIPDRSVRVSNDTIDTIGGIIFHEYRIPIIDGVRTYRAFFSVSTLLRYGNKEFPEVMRIGAQTYYYIIDFQNGGIDIIFEPDFPYIVNDSNIYTPPESLYYYYFDTTRSP